jgi:Domain of unknown function (DUF427)
MTWRGCVRLSGVRHARAGAALLPRLTFFRRNTWNPICPPRQGVTMTDRPVKIPGPDHPIAITPQPARVVVTAGGKVIADTRRALNLQEASYPAVQYIPRDDVDMSQLTRTDHASHCPRATPRTSASRQPAPVATMRCGRTRSRTKPSRKSLDMSRSTRIASTTSTSSGKTPSTRKNKNPPRRAPIWCVAGRVFNAAAPDAPHVLLWAGAISRSRRPPWPCALPPAGG